MKRKRSGEMEDGREGAVVVEKSSNDKLEYRLLSFDSGFEALLISTGDEKKIKAAASMAVGVGSFSDPQGRCEGLAHFLEHMLFMGSEKYPGEDVFEDFLSKNGGYSNAFTEAGHTCYYIEVNKAALAEALDMFAQLFIAPLMTVSAAEREINAIDSEFRLTQNSDGSRVEQLFASFAKAGHPFRTFGWGNLDSLSVATKKAGVDINSELRAFYVEHYRAPRMRLCVYAVQPLDVMEAAVRASFAALRGAAPGEPTKGPQEAALAAAGAPFLSERLPKVLRVRPVKDTHKLSLSWQLPPTLHLYKSKPMSYIQHLVGHEGAGSLLAYLKRLGLATALTAGVSDDSFETNSMCCIFCVDISLTIAGLAAWHDVAHATMLYLDMLRREGPQQWVHDEINQVQDMGWRFLQEENPTDQVQELACAMLPVYEIERRHILKAPWISTEWKPEVISQLLEQTRPEGLMVCVLSSAYGRAKGAKDAGDDQDDAGSNSDAGGGEDDAEVGDAGQATDEAEESEDAASGEEEKEEEGGDTEGGAAEAVASDPSFDSAAPPSVEPLFGTEYWEAPAEEVRRLVEQCRAPPPSGSCVAEAPAMLRLPDRNIFLATDFALRPLASASAAAVPSLPTDGLRDRYKSFPLLPAQLPHAPVALPLAAALGLRAWHLQDSVFLTPRSEIWLKLSTDQAPAQPRSVTAQVLLTFLGKALSEALNEVAYLADQASLHVWVSAQHYGLDLKVGGFHHKLPSLLDAGLKEVFAFADAAVWERRLQDRAFLARLEAQREQLLRSYRNAYLRPGDQAADLRRLLVMPHRHAAPEKARALEGLDVRALAAFAQELIPKLRAEVLVTGNATEADAEQLAAALPTSLREGAPLSELPRQPPLPAAVLPLGPPTVWVEASPDVGNRNVAVELHWQLDATTASRPKVVLDLLEAIMSEPLFDVLRTKQQIGYVASCGMRYTMGVLGFSVWLLSSKVAPSEICRRVEAFLDEFRKRLVDMPAEDFERHVASLAGQKMEPDRTLLSVHEGAWSELQDRKRVFHRHLEEAVHLASVGREDLLGALDRCMMPLAPQRRLAVVVVIGGQAKATPAAELEALLKDYPGSRVVSSQAQFLASTSLHENMM